MITQTKLKLDLWIQQTQQEFDIAEKDNVRSEGDRMAAKLLNIKSTPELLTKELARQTLTYLFLLDPSLLIGRCFQLYVLNSTRMLRASYQFYLIHRNGVFFLIVQDEDTDRRLIMPRS